MTHSSTPIEFKAIVELGQIIISAKASKEFSLSELFGVLQRHATGDWGDVTDQELGWNECAVLHGDELLSRYWQPERGFVIITDKQITTVYTNNEY